MQTQSLNALSSLRNGCSCRFALISKQHLSARWLFEPFSMCWDLLPKSRMEWIRASQSMRWQSLRQSAVTERACKQISDMCVQF